MDFSEALRLLKLGKRVSRSGWNGKGMFVYLVEGTTVDPSVLRGAAADAVNFVAKKEGRQIEKQTICGHIDMKAADGTIVVGWLASQTDILATDWGFSE